MKYKYIILLISCSELDKNNPCIQMFDKYQILKRYQKVYLDKFKNDIKFFYIEYKKDINEDVVEIDDFIFIKGNEDPMIPNLLNKNIIAINYINKKYNFDFILRTNLSSIWNISKLLSLYNEIPKSNFFGGYVIFNSFISGTGIFISKDLIEKLLKINTNYFNVLDDVAISTHMKNQGIKMTDFNILTNYKMNYQILNENETDINAHTHKNNNLEINDTTYIDDILYFRVKNNTIDRDLLVTKKIIKKIYNIEL
jgi:hypothetical protein